MKQDWKGAVGSVVISVDEACQDSRRRSEVLRVRRRNVSAPNWHGPGRYYLSRPSPIPPILYFPG